MFESSNVMRHLKRPNVPVLLELALGLGLLGLELWIWQQLVAPPMGMLGGALLSYLVLASVVWATFPPTLRWLGWANRVTLLRATLVALFVGSLPFPAFLANHSVALAGLALLALMLDGIDGWVARRTRTNTWFGAHFDMELDAGLVLALSVAVALLGKVEAWILLIGVMRYAFVIAGLAWPWLRAELPERLRRKAGCVVQVATLLVCLLPVVDATWATRVSAIALLLLFASFALDVRWLWRHAR